jgi:hypothetical protein
MQTSVDRARNGGTGRLNRSATAARVPSGTVGTQQSSRQQWSERDGDHSPAAPQPPSAPPTTSDLRASSGDPPGIAGTATPAFGPSLMPSRNERARRGALLLVVSMKEAGLSMALVGRG